MAEKTEAKGDEGKLDKILSHLDSTSTKLDAVSKRMDAMETSYGDGMKRLDAACERMDSAAKKDAEKEEDEKKKADAAKADAARADAEKEEEKKKADAAKKDADDKKEEEDKKADAARADAAGGAATKKLQEQIDALSRRVPADLPPDIRQRMVSFQSKAERVFQALGDSAGAPPAANGESEMDYRVRLLSGFKKHSKSYKDADLAKIGDAAVFGMIEDAIYADAVAEASNPSTIAPGILIPQRIKDAAGREITRYKGDAGSCWDVFNPPVRHVRRLLTQGSARVH